MNIKEFFNDLGDELISCGEELKNDSAVYLEMGIGETSAGMLRGCITNIISRLNQVIAVLKSAKKAIK